MSADTLRHPDVVATASVQVIDILITQLRTTPKPRARQVVIRQLYSAGATVRDIATAIERDLASGDAILSARTHDEQNTAPEAQMWLTWLAEYEQCHQLMARMSEALRNAPEMEEA